VRESLLDAIPGVSATRKRALLAKFGSVDRLRAATPESIAEIPGIGKALAEKICAALTPAKGVAPTSSES
jgi:excinuclease ABC subunit C